MVDLGDPAIADHHERPRFVARVCAPDERDRVAGARDPKRALWALFAAKEAAYKVVAKLGPPPPLAHRRFEVAADARCVRWGDLVLALAIEHDADWVHAVAWRGAPPELRAVGPVAAGADASAAVRAAVCAAAAERLGCAPDAVRVARDPVPGGWTGRGPPYLLAGNRRASVDISLSHDGRFFAFALAVA